MAVLRVRAAPVAPRWPFVAVGPLSDRLAACIVPIGGKFVQDAGPRGLMRPSYFGGAAAASLESGGHPLIASGSGSSTGIWGTYDGLGLSSWVGITLAVALDVTRYPAASTFVSNPSLGLGGQTVTPKFGFDRSNSASYRYNVYSQAYSLGYTTYSAPSEPAWELLILSEISATSRQAWRNGTSIWTNTSDNTGFYFTRTNWTIGPSAANWTTSPGTTTNRHEVHYMAWWDRVLTESERSLLQRPETRWAWFEEYGRKVYFFPTATPPGGFLAAWASQRSRIIGAGLH